VKVDLPPPIDAPEQTGKFDKRARPHEHFIIKRKNLVIPPPLQSEEPHYNPDSKFDVSPVDGSFAKSDYNPNSNFDDVSPVDESFPK
jgi:hypothetical protein